MKHLHSTHETENGNRSSRTQTLRFFNRMFVFLSIIVLFALAPDGEAQSTAFTYQGQLLENGAPANSTNDFRFRLLSDALGANQIGTDLLVNDLVVSNGLFTATIDFGAAALDGSERWLEVSVRPGTSAGAYTALTPLQRVTATPYAVQSLRANTISGIVPSTALSGTYTGAVTLNNAANDFTGMFHGNGGGLSNVDAVTLGRLGAANFWQLGGNNIGAGQFIGSTNNQPLELWVNDGRALRRSRQPRTAQ